MERVLLLYRDARGTDTSVAPHVKVILDSGSFTWDSMHNTYGVPANADGDSTITFIAFWSGIYRKCYYDQSHNLRGSAVSANAEYYDESALGFYKFTSTSKKNTNISIRSVQRHTRKPDRNPRIYLFGQTYGQSTNSYSNIL